MRKKTQEEFVKEVYDLVGDEYTVLGEYITANTKIRMRHNTCGHEYEVTPSNFITRDRCPNCRYISLRKTTDEFKQHVYDLVGDEYTVLGEYKTVTTKIRMRHNTCGHEYEVTPKNFKRGDRCPKCGKRRKDADTFKKEVYDLVGDEYTVLGEYENLTTKILMRHNKCGYEYKVKPHSFKFGGARCPKCAGNIKKDIDIFKKEVYDLVGDEYTVLGEYKNTNSNIRIRHNACGYEYDTKPRVFK